MNTTESNDGGSLERMVRLHVVTVTDSDGETVVKLQPTLAAATAHKNRIATRCERFGMTVKIYRLEEVPPNDKVSDPATPR